MIKTDFHLHSYHSGDSDTPMEDSIKRAIELDYTHICFTEHNDFCYPYNHGEDSELFTLEPESYYKEYLELSDKYKSKIKVLFGVELGLQPICCDLNTEFVNKYPFDFIIGSSHLCKGQDPYFPEYFENISEETAYTEYFESIIENINCYKDFDIYGHIDYIVRYGPNKNSNYSYIKYKDVIDELLKTVINNNKGIEINTSGLKYGLGYTHPHKDIIKRYRELGGEIISVGSDAHVPEHIGYDFHVAKDILEEAGFKYYTIFEKRKPQYLKI